VPTRVDPNENELLTKFQVRFERLADERNTAPEDLKKLGKKFWDLQIPYRTIFSYQVRRVIGPGSIADPTKALENAYWKLACHLALLAPETHVVRQKFADPLQREFPALLPKVVMSYTPDGPEEASGVRERLRGAGIKLWPDLTHEATSDDLETSTRVINQAAHLVVVLSDGAQADDGVIRRKRLLRYFQNGVAGAKRRKNAVFSAPRRPDQRLADKRRGLLVLIRIYLLWILTKDNIVRG
jgi:hypothetical protein